MERNPPRKYKRRYKKKEEYGKRFKDQMNIKNFRKYRLLDGVIDDMMINIIQTSDLTKKISLLPKEIQKKLYILSMRNYWKMKTLTTIYRPMYYDYYSYMEKEKAKVYYDNIHFMHLECNTIESTKEWIPGCQCSFCLNENHQKYTKEYKQAIYDKLLENYDDDDIDEYYKCIHCYDMLPNYWNTQFSYHINVNIDEDFQYSFLSHKIYDPLKGARCTIYDKIKDIDSPLYFSNELIGSYTS
jgi:hypothetical protein